MIAIPANNALALRKKRVSQIGDCLPKFDVQSPRRRKLRRPHVLRLAEFYDFALTRRSFSAARGIDGFASRRQMRDPTSATSDGGYTETDAAWEDAGLFRRAHACHASALQRLKASLAYEGRPREDFRTRPSSLWPPSFGPDGGQRPPLRREVSNSGTRVCAREHIHRAKEPAARLSVRYWQDEYVRTKRRMHALNRARMLARSGSRRTKANRNAPWNGQMVQRDEGLRLHSARSGRQGRVRPHQRSGAIRDAWPA